MASAALKLRTDHRVYFKPARRGNYPRWRYRNGRIERNPHLGGYMVYRGKVVRPVDIIPGLTGIAGQAIIPGSTTFSTPGTFSFTTPTYNQLDIQVLGAAGGDGGNGTTGGKTPMDVPGGPGGSGGLVHSIFFNMAISGIFTVVVGTGGAAGIGIGGGSSPTDGNPGGGSSFGGFMLAGGGGGGQSANNGGASGSPGTASGGNVANIAGGAANTRGANGQVIITWS